MLVLLVAVAVGLWAGAVAGGRLGNVQYLRLTQAWLVLVALAIQLVVFSPLSAPLGAHVVVSLHLLSYALLLAFALLNRHNVGVLITAAGVACNALAIALNGGYMPASRAALRLAGLPVSAIPHNNSELATSGDRLRFLGDVFALPHSLPLANVFSLGDVIIGIGVALVIVSAMRRASRDQHGQGRRFTVDRR